MEIRLKRDKNTNWPQNFLISWKLSMCPLVHEVIKSQERKMCQVLLFVCLSAFPPLLFLSYFGLELYFLCLRRAIDARRLKGFQGTQENQQGPNCLELKTRISSENWSSGNHQVGIKWGFHNKFLWECKMWIFHSTTSGWHL